MKTLFFFIVLLKSFEGSKVYKENLSDRSNKTQINAIIITD